MHRLGECVPLCLLIYETTVVLSVDIITQEWSMYCMAFFSAKRMAIISRILIWSWDWSSVKHHERIVQSAQDELPIHNDWHP